MIIEGEEYDCLLNEESVPHNCVRIQDSLSELEPSVSAAAVVTASAMFALTIAIVIICFRAARKKD